MNASAAPASGMLTGTTRIVFMAVGLVLTAIVVYYLYKFMQGDATREDMVIYDMVGNGLAATKETTFDTANMPTIYGGGEYSISMWIYVSRWTTDANKLLLRIQSGSSSTLLNTLVLYLGKQKNKLGIRVSSEGSDSIINAQQLGLIKSTTTPYGDSDTDFKKCDIESVDLQRWVNITVVLAGRTTDVYIDGKLSRSCVNSGLFKVADPQTAKIIVGGDGANGTTAAFGSIRAANFAYTPDMVYSIYQKGPKDESFLKQLASWFNPSEYSFSLKRNGQDIIAATTSGSSTS